MKMNKDDLEALIEHIVHKELEKMLPKLVKESMANVFSNLLTEGNVNNSRKRELLETSYNDPSELDEYPTFDRNKFRANYASMMGEGNKEEITMNYMTGNDASGTPLPIDPNSIPETVKKAINRNYKDILDAWKRR